MSDPDAYVALIASLPGSERLFVAKQPPLSRIRLERRLSALSAEDAQVLARIEHALSWSEYAIEVTEEAMQRCQETLAAIPQPTLKALFIERMDMRAAVAALRMRRRGAAAPQAPFGVGRWRNHIPAHWNETYFRLDTPMPWLKDADRMLENHDPRGLERLLLEQSYRNLKRHGAQHHFDFEAVAIYVLIWNIFDRWAQSDPRDAAARFEKLAEKAMAAAGDINIHGDAA